jgi:proteasome lid subunit RPN8/RPN11
MALTLGARERRTIEQHGEASYPHECCGFLLGAARDLTRSVTRVALATNETETDGRRRYVISPESYLRAEKEAEAQGLEIVGFYHSHPDVEAVPSEFDRSHAFPGVSYVIVSVVEGKAAALRSWELEEDRSAFRAEPFVDPIE